MYVFIKNGKQARYTVFKSILYGDKAADWR